MEKVNSLVIKRGPHINRKGTGKEKKLSIENSLLKETILPHPEKQVLEDFISQNQKKMIRVFVAGGSRSGKDPIYEQEAYLLGQKIAQMNYRLDFGLSSQGIMGAVARGVLETWLNKKEKGLLPIQGVTTKEYLAFEKETDLLNAISNVIVAKTLEERKRQLLEADFVIFASGGVGTLDELVYDCVAMQDGFLSFKPFILFNVKGFFHHLLEYLKEITEKGFANALPFIVVDDAFEAGIAFELIPYYYKKGMSKQESLKSLRHIIHVLPYVINSYSQNKRTTIRKIIKDIKEAYKNNKTELLNAIEEAYLNKEIERMYERLSRSGRDTAIISDKLASLKQKKQRD